MLTISRPRFFAACAITGMVLLLTGTTSARQRGAGSAEQRSGPSASTGQLDQALRETIERHDVPGVVAMSATKNRIVYEGAFGLAEIKNPRRMSADAIFRIASMTKAITSVAAMQLVERGRLSLDDRVEKYLPNFASLWVFDSFDKETGDFRLRRATSPVTVRHLLTHTSGLGYTFTSTTLRDFKPKNSDQNPVGPLLFEPGQRWHYGTSTDWLGRLVETVSGLSLSEYFRREILEPLGMSDTFFNVPDHKQPRLVNLHRREKDGRLVEQPRQPPRAVTEFNGGGGLFSTAGDYVKFLQMLLNGGQLNNARILSPDSVAAMGQNQIGSLGVGAMKSAIPDLSHDFSFIADGQDKWGLGFLITSNHVEGKRSAGSLSWAGIDNTYFWLDPNRGVCGVIMMQLLPFADPKALGVYDTFERGVYQLLGRP
jgi:CubicO group peptidase (beta-lactamase class C family)